MSLEQQHKQNVQLAASGEQTAKETEEALKKTPNLTPNLNDPNVQRPSPFGSKSETPPPVADPTQQPTTQQQPGPPQQEQRPINTQKVPSAVQDPNSQPTQSPTVPPPASETNGSVQPKPPTGEFGAGAKPKLGDAPQPGQGADPQQKTGVNFKPKGQWVEGFQNKTPNPSGGVQTPSPFGPKPETSPGEFSSPPKTNHVNPQAGGDPPSNGGTQPKPGPPKAGQGILV